MTNDQRARANQARALADRALQRAKGYAATIKRERGEWRELYVCHFHTQMNLYRGALRLAKTIEGR